ncbi:MAG: hypothetical protein P1P84_03660 [Deferrisomatales bacterium]|nr:hypothetical protein [Deferrisomatales bacterium]
MKRAFAAMTGFVMLLIPYVGEATFQTEVQFSPDGLGLIAGYPITNVLEFDWSSVSGDMVLVNQLPLPATVRKGTAGETQVNTLVEFFAQAQLGDEVTFDAHVNTRLGAFLGNSSTVYPSGYEVTAAASFRETGVLLSPGTLLFLAISGNAVFFVDTAENAVVESGSGFTDGIPILEAQFDTVDGIYATGGPSAVTVLSTVTNYDPAFLDTDPAAMRTLTNVSIVTTIEDHDPLQDTLAPGGTAGLALYTVMPADLVLKADANTPFFAEEEVLLGSCRVTAGGNKDGVYCPLKANGLPDTKLCMEDIYHTWGGQAGAPPTVDGNWTHHYKPSSRESFNFHSNDLFYIGCSDPGPFCEPARPADNRQIDFAGLGKFNATKGSFEAFPGGEVCFMVHLEDLGEPGQGGKWPVSVAEGLDCEHCPGTPVVNGDASDLTTRSDCRDCTDYYEIQIFDSPANDGRVCLGNRIWVNGQPDTVRCGAGDPQLDGFFTRAGNVQMHPDNNGP